MKERQPRPLTPQDRPETKPTHKTPVPVQVTVNNKVDRRSFLGGVALVAAGAAGGVIGTKGAEIIKKLSPDSPLTSDGEENPFRKWYEELAKKYLTLQEENDQLKKQLENERADCLTKIEEKDNRIRALEAQNRALEIGIDLVLSVHEEILDTICDLHIDKALLAGSELLRLSATLAKEINTDLADLSSVSQQRIIWLISTYEIFKNREEVTDRLTGAIDELYLKTTYPALVWFQGFIEWIKEKTPLAQTAERLINFGCLKSKPLAEIKEAAEITLGFLLYKLPVIIAERKEIRQKKQIEQEEEIRANPPWLLELASKFEKIAQKAGQKSAEREAVIKEFQEIINRLEEISQLRKSLTPELWQETLQSLREEIEKYPGISDEELRLYGLRRTKLMNEFITSPTGARFGGKNRGPNAQ